VVAGVSWQVFSLGLFAILCAEFVWKVRKGKEEDLTREFQFAALRQTARFRIFLWAAAGATLAIFVKSVFRCAELRDGFKGQLANDEMTSMILEGAIILIAVGLLTVWHPGLAFRGKWTNAAWSVRSGAKESRKEVVTRSREERRIWGPEKGGREETGAKQKFREAPMRPYWR
jgi:RTA1 like protein